MAFGSICPKRKNRWSFGKGCYLVIAVRNAEDTKALSQFLKNGLAEITAKLAETQVVFQKPGGEPETAGYSTAVNALPDGTKMERLGWTVGTSLMEGMKKVFLIHDRSSWQQKGL